MAILRFDQAVLQGLAKIAERLNLEPITADARGLNELVRVAAQCPDEPAYFPAGKYQTIKNINNQLDEWAREFVERRWDNREIRD
jgi:hypothetical protein